jgi:uncharacterized membrane protein
MKSETPLRWITTAARGSLKGNWGGAIGVVLLLSLLLGGTSLIGMSWLFSGALTVGLCSFFLKVRSQGGRVSMLFDGFDCFGKSFAVLFLTNLFIMFWSLLFIIPGIIKTYSYSMAFFILADDPEAGAVESITRSRRLMEGNKGRLFCLWFRFFGWGILCIFTLGIGFLWLWPYMMASMAAFYQDLKGRA